MSDNDIITLADRDDTLNYRVGMPMHMDPSPANWDKRAAYKRTRWYHVAWWRFTAWFRRAILRRRPVTVVVTHIDEEAGEITVDVR